MELLEYTDAMGGTFGCVSTAGITFRITDTVARTYFPSPLLQMDHVDSFKGSDPSRLILHAVANGIGTVGFCGEGGLQSVTSGNV